MTYLDYREECPLCGEYAEYCLCSLEDGDENDHETTDEEE